MNEEKLIRILKSLPSFAKNFLIIHDKSGAERKFELNRAQQYIHERLEAQLKATGKIRALVLKGRQQGVSTYEQARFFHKIVRRSAGRREMKVGKARNKLPIHFFRPRGIFIPCSEIPNNTKKSG